MERPLGDEEPNGFLDNRSGPYNSAFPLQRIPMAGGSQTSQPAASTRRLPTFDQYMCETEFPRHLDCEEALSQALLARNQVVTPTANEQAAVTGLVIRVKSALDSISASNSLPSLKIEEYRDVGSFKKGTMLSRSNVADLAVIIKTLPTHESIKLLGENIVEILKNDSPDIDEVFAFIPRDFGCEIAGTQAVLRILIVISVDELSKLEEGLHLNSKILRKNLAALRHAHWFDENAAQPTIKILIRLVKDIKKRSRGFAALDVWTIELMSHYCVTYTPNGQILSLPHSFRRLFQLISAGFLLHSSLGVGDPCDQTRRINHGFSLPEADTICRSAQFIVRLLMHEKFERLCGIKDPQLDLTAECEIDHKLNIAPLSEGYSEAKIVNFPPLEYFHSQSTIV